MCLIADKLQLGIFRIFFWYLCQVKYWNMLYTLQIGFFYNIYLISSTVSSNTACSQKCVKISAVFKNHLNDCNILNSVELASCAFHTLTARLQKKYFLLLRRQY